MEGILGILKNESSTVMKGKQYRFLPVTRDARGPELNDPYSPGTQGGGAQGR